MPRLALVVTSLVLVMAACGQEDDGSDKPVNVVATTSHVADLAREVGGRRVEVEQLLRPGVDPHDYEPRPSDVRKIADADLVLRSGGEVDEWLGELMDNAGGRSRGLTLIEHVRRRGDDPHWWQDVRNARLAVLAIADELARVDPEGAADYRAAGRRYAARLDRLDASIADCIGQVPARQRNLVTTHDSLGYFAARYRLRLVGALIPSRSTQSQPSARDTQSLVEQLRRLRVRAIFPESALNPRLERAVAREADAEVGGALWADSLGPPGSGGGTYVQAMASNAAAIAAGLSGGRVACRARG